MTGLYEPPSPSTVPTRGNEFDGNNADIGDDRRLSSTQNFSTLISKSDRLPYSNASEPFSLRDYVKECLWPGMGLFGESFLLFSIGVFRPIWNMLYPECFVTREICNGFVVNGITYSVVLGIIVGMIWLGYLANKIGRRMGSLFTATFMSISSFLLVIVTFFLIEDPVWLFTFYIISLFSFGIGIGGEYPLSATLASERAMGDMRRRGQMEHVCPSESEETPQRQNQSFQTLNPTVLRYHNRGKRILLLFSMQGLGIFLNCFSITGFLMLTHQTGYEEEHENEDSSESIFVDGANGGLTGIYETSSIVLVWRLVYSIGAIVLAFVLLSRYLYLDESVMWEEDNRTRTLMSHIQSLKNTSSVTNKLSSMSIDVSPLKDQSVDVNGGFERDLVFSHFGHRLFGTSMTWLLWDVAFYGNKLHQSKFLLALTGQKVTLVEFTSAATLNSFVSLCGYITAAFLVDKMGRYKLQLWSFLITGVLFFACGSSWAQSSSSPITLLLLYFGTSFFGQCGPNATTFIIPAEIFPTATRSMCHGISAAFGKLGALIAAILFNYVDDMEIFRISGFALLFAAFITVLTIPESTQLDLFELDKKWHMIVAGRKLEYKGPANERRFASLCEQNNLLGASI